MLVAISYRGIRLAEGNLEGDGDPGFLPFDAPLPVGTRVMVFTPEAPPREAIVSQVVEDVGGGAVPGMKLRWAPAAAVPEVVEMEAAPADERIDAQPAIEPADSPTRTQSMPAVSPPPEEGDGDGEIEPADSPRQTIMGMPALTDEMAAALAGQSSESAAEPEPEPEPEGAMGKKRRRRRR